MYLLLTVLAVQKPALPLASPVSDTAHVVIVATTDVHGRVLGWDYVRDAAAPGGLSRAATMVETLRAQYLEQVVLVDAGDLIEGNLFAAYFAERDSQRPHPVVDALNAMQYDAATGCLRLRDGGAGARHGRRHVPLRLRQHLQGRERHAGVSSPRRRHARWREDRDHRLHDAWRNGLGPEPGRRSNPGAADRGGCTPRHAPAGSRRRRSQSRADP